MTRQNHGEFLLGSEPVVLPLRGEGFQWVGGETAERPARWDQQICRGRDESNRATPGVAVWTVVAVETPAQEISLENISSKNSFHTTLGLIQLMNLMQPWRAIPFLSTIDNHRVNGARTFLSNATRISTAASESEGWKIHIV